MRQHPPKIERHPLTFGRTLTVTTVEETCGSFPSQWEGRTFDCGMSGHARYQVFGPPWFDQKVGDDMGGAMSWAEACEIAGLVPYP